MTSVTPTAPGEDAEHPAGLTITTSPAAKGATSSTPPLALPPNPAHRIHQSAAAWELTEPAKFPSRPGAEPTGSGVCRPGAGQEEAEPESCSKAHVNLQRREYMAAGEYLQQQS